MSYFSFTTPFIRRTLARAEQINAVFTAVEAGFAAVPAANVINEGRTSFGTDTGAANIYVVQLAYAPTGYTTGMMAAFQPVAANTGSATLNLVSSTATVLGAKALLRPDGSALLAGDMVAGGVVEARYDGTAFRLLTLAGTGALGYTPLNPAANLSDLANAATARANLGADLTYVARANNLSDLPNAATCRANLGAQAALGYTPLNPAANLSDLADAATSRANLGAQAALGFTPVNKAGDTMTGTLSAPGFYLTGNQGSYGLLGTTDLEMYGPIGTDPNSFRFRIGGTQVLKYDLTDGMTLAAPLGIGSGGTGAGTASAARASLGAVNIAGDTMTGQLYASAGVRFGPGSYSAGQALAYTSTTLGTVLTGVAGSVNELVLTGASGSIAARIPAGTSDFTVDNILTAGTFFLSGFQGTAGINGGTRIEYYGIGSGANKIDQFVNTTLVSTIDGSGNLTVTGNITANSDRKLKTDIAPLTGSLDAVLAMQGVRYTRISDGSRQIGLIAQDVEAVRPEYVHTNDEGTKSLAYANIVADLIEAVKTLSARVAELESR